MWCVCETTQARHLTTTLTSCCVQHVAVGILLGENVFAVARNFSDCFLSLTKSTILSIDDSLLYRGCVGHHDGAPSDDQVVGDPVVRV